jgi:hypothetical protein
MARSKAKDIETDEPQGEQDKTATENGAGPDHNTLTEDQERALFFHHLNRVKAQKAVVASETGSLRSLYKIAKADGFSKKDIDFALSLESRKEEETLEERRRQQRIAFWLQHPIGTQPDMFDFQPDRTPLADRAYEAGKIAGMKGEPNRPPHDENTEAGQKWMAGWHKGQELIFAVGRQKDAEAFNGDGDETDEGEGDGDTAPLPLGDQPATHQAAH